MKPKTPHWADIAAARVIGERGDKARYVVASGITPSGTVHIGNFREAITVDLVARALRDLGKEVRFIYSWDDFDTFRKVPANLPNQTMLSGELRKPISRVPDPYGKEKSYARANEADFESSIAEVGISPEYLYQSAKYESGVYAESMRHALEQRGEIKTILNEYRKEPYGDSWLPTAIYCEKCERDEIDWQRYDGEWSYSYHCKRCNEDVTIDIRTTKNLKLNWRTDWPMRWAFEKVDFEPGGKDHSSEGGSFDTGSRIVKKVWGWEPPSYLQYDFVSIKGENGKMSSSKGKVLTLASALEVYTAQMVRWIFASQRPNHDFALAFDEDVIKTYDEFDRAEIAAISPPPANLGKWPVLRRCYELSLVDGKMPDQIPFRPGFRELCNRLQVCDGDFERTATKFYSGELKSDQAWKFFNERSEKAWAWLQNYAPEEFCYRINRDPVELTIEPKISAALASLKMLISGVDLAVIDSKDLNQRIYDDVLRANDCEAKVFFQVVYQKLISRDRGPRLPGFLKEIGAERVIKLI